MDEKGLIGNFLNIPGYEDFTKENRITTLSIALKGARHLCGRDIQSGKIKPPNELIDKTINDIEKKIFYSSQFLGLTSYLIILDLIGCVFQNKSKKDFVGDGVEHALIHFSDLEKDYRGAIKALRNSLTHNFGLGNPSHIFSLSLEYEDMITLPNPPNQWGRSKSDKDASRTLINELLVCDFIESIIQTLVEEFNKENLTLKKGMNESVLKSNFTIL